MWPIINHTNKNAFLGTTFICLDIYKKFHRFLHTFSGPNAIPMLLAAYASSKEVIYITTTQIQKSSLDCVKQ
ncbi:unnamed protein product [Brassica oleracea]